MKKVSIKVLLLLVTVLILGSVATAGAKDMFGERHTLKIPNIGEIKKTGVFSEIKKSVGKEAAQSPVEQKGKSIKNNLPRVFIDMETGVDKP